MATNLDLDPALVEQVLVLSGERTKKAAVTMALQDFVSRRRQRGLLELFGTVEFDEDWDHKADRGRP